MIDENAFGFLISYATIEDDEYALEREEFLARYQRFRSTLLDCIRELPLGRGVRALDIGHAVYVEVAEGDEVEDPVNWLRQLRARLGEQDLESIGILTYGGRWVDEDSAGAPTAEPLGDVALMRAWLPSEPLRRALDADAAARPTDDDAVPGWGPGLYVDADVIEAMGRKLKNEPTLLRASSGAFFRVGR